MVDLATSRVGGEVVWCNDQFFADVSNLIAPSVPVWKEGEFTEHGKWMDGWETRRRRQEGHDSCIIRLGLPGVIRSVTVDTAFFTGNFPESFSLDACGVPPDRLDGAEWVELISPTALRGDSQAVFDVAEHRRVTHLRFSIYPDGGVARLRVDGDPIPGLNEVCPESGVVDLASARVGGRGTGASDAHYSSPATLVSPTEPEGMWDGWETARRRGAGWDWAIVELGLPGLIESVDVDTRHFKGNAPGWVTIDVAVGDGDWAEACGRTAVEPHRLNRIELGQPVPGDRVRLNIHPDGGVARLRVWGRPHPDTAADTRMRYVNALFRQDAAIFFETACAAPTWVEAMVAGRPYAAPESLLAAAEACFDRLDRHGWLAAFAAHPRIGEGRGRQGEQGEALSAREQGGLAGAGARVRDELAEVNRRYEDRFGYTYIVRAEGRSPEELLTIARDRLANDAETELKEAAGQQRQITLGRLRKLLCLEVESP